MKRVPGGRVAVALVAGLVVVLAALAVGRIATRDGESQALPWKASEFLREGSGEEHESEAAERDREFAGYSQGVENGGSGGEAFEALTAAQQWAEARRRRRHVGGGVVRGRRVALDHVLDDLGQDEVAALDAVGFVREEPLPSSEPAARGADGTAGQEVEADPEGATDRAGRLPLLEVRSVRPLQDRDVLLVPREHERRDREQLEVVAVERGGRVGRDERSVGPAPRPEPVRVARLPDVVSDHGESMRSGIE